MRKYDAEAIGNILDAVSQGLVEIEPEAKASLFVIFSFLTVRTMPSNSPGRVVISGVTRHKS